MEDFAVYVDGGFATKPYSALPDLLFAPKIQDSSLVLPDKAVQDFVDPAPALNWQKNVFVFQGHRGVFGAAGDKLHSKTTYLEYLDAKSIRHYVVIWGSANRSSNAGDNNADGLYMLDSTDPEVGKQVRPYFDALRAEKRMVPFANAYLDRRFLETIHPTGGAETVFTEKYISKFRAYLDKPGPRSQLRGLLKTLQNAGASNPYGENLMTVIDWWIKNADKDKVFDWSEFHLALRLAHPNVEPRAGFMQDVLKRWLGENPSSKQVLDFDRMVSDLELSNQVATSKQTKNIQRIIKQSCRALLRLNLPRYEVNNP